MISITPTNPVQFGELTRKAGTHSGVPPFLPFLPANLLAEQVPPPGRGKGTEPRAGGSAGGDGNPGYPQPRQGMAFRSFLSCWRTRLGKVGIGG